MSVERTEASDSQTQAREALVMQLNFLSKAFEQMTRLIWAHPDACHGAFVRLENLGLASSCLAQASKVLASDDPSMGAQLTALRSLRAHFENTNSAIS